MTATECYGKNSVIVLTITEAPIRELLNFLCYQQQPALLNERAQNLPPFAAVEIPSSLAELKELLSARRQAKNKNLIVDLEKNKKHVGVVIHNFDAQFWTHYFDCGIGLVNLSFYQSLSLAQTSVEMLNRRVAHDCEYQWFTHRLDRKFFDGLLTPRNTEQLANYFIDKVNPHLVNPYTIYSENPKQVEACKFVRGSLENFKQVMKWVYFVCQQEKQKNAEVTKKFVYPHITIACGNLRHAPKVELTNELLLNAVGALAITENAPYSKLQENYSRRTGGNGYEWERKHKHRIYLNLEHETRDATHREKLAARSYLIDWLSEQGEQGKNLIKYWKLKD